MELYAYQPEDCPALLALFRDTVYTVCARDYSPAELAAWAGGAWDAAAWDQSFRRHVTWVAREGPEIVGFGDLDAQAGYLDRLYVHARFQRQGIATALCDALEAASVPPFVTTCASRTAQGFFLKRGYRIVERQRVLRRGVYLENFRMEKTLAGPGEMEGT